MKEKYKALKHKGCFNDVHTISHEAVHGQNSVLSHVNARTKRELIVVSGGGVSPLVRLFSSPLLFSSLFFSPLFTCTLAQLTSAQTMTLKTPEGSMAGVD